MTVVRSECPACGQPVVIHTAEEGTSFMVPANTAEQTECKIDAHRMAAFLRFIFDKSGAPMPPGMPDVLARYPE